MTESEEQAYEKGSRAAWIMVLRQALTELGHDQPDDLVALGRALLELQETRSALGELCNDVDLIIPADAYLPDVVRRISRCIGE